MELWTMGHDEPNFYKKFRNPESGYERTMDQGLLGKEQAIAKDLGLILRNCNDCVKKRLIIVEDLTS